LAYIKDKTESSLKVSISTQGNENTSSVPSEQKITNPYIFGVIGLIAIILIGVFTLAALGRDIEQVIYFVGPSLLSLMGIVAVLMKTDNQNTQIGALHDKTDVISKRVNGELDAKFRSLNTRIDGLSNQVKLSTINVPQTEIDSPDVPETGASA
jgi:putative Mn2+ efflux pump MntP